MKKYIHFLVIIFIMLSVMLIFLFLVDSDFDFLKENLSGTTHDMHHMHSLHNASIIILTFIIACVAWFQLSGIAKNGEGDFLLRIDERLSNESIIKARVIIHEIYSKSKTQNPNSSEDQHCEFMANEIYLLGERKDKKSIKDYVYILNFLDFLETISLFTNNGYISPKEIDDLMNQSIIFFYKIFSKRIHQRRQKYNDSTFYYQFEKLYLKIQARKQRCYCCCCYCLKKGCVVRSFLRLFN